MQQRAGSERNHLNYNSAYALSGRLMVTSVIHFKPLYCYEACRETIICRDDACNNTCFLFLQIASVKGHYHDVAQART